MNDCTAIRHDLACYVLGSLEAAEIAALERHVSACEQCRAEVEELSALPDLMELAAERSPQVPPGLRARVLAAAEHRAPARRRLPAAVAAALVIGFVAGAAAMAGFDAWPPADVRVALVADDGAPTAVSGSAALRDTSAGVRIDLDADGLRPDADVAYYHVWLEQPDGHRVSSGTVLPAADGAISAALTCGGELADYSGLAVTAHPYHGADGEPVISVALP